MIAKLLFESQRFLTLRNCTFTIFTPTYDRKKRYQGHMTLFSR
jgi:hypothetical protein